MPRRPAPLPPGLGSVFTRQQALGAGVSARRLRARDLEIPFRGVRIDPTGAGASPDRTEGAGRRDRATSADPAPLEQDRLTRDRVLRTARAYGAVMPSHAFFAGRTAAVLWGAPIDHGDDLEVAVYAPARAARRRGIRGIKVSPALATVRDHLGLPVTSPASTWAMLGNELSVRELVVIGDALVRVPRDERGRRREQSQLATIDELRRATGAGARRGAPRLRTAVELVRVGSASPLETEYRLDAVAAGLPEPELDVDVFDARGRRIGITEVLYRDYGVLVEIEGDHHRTNRAQWNRDIEKYAAYAAEGWAVVRVTSSHIRGGRRQAVAYVRAALLRGGWRPA